MLDAINTRELMSEAKFYESYSRYDDEKGRYETWDEAVERVMNMHRVFYADKMTDELSAMIDEVEQAYKEKLILGAQRALQFGGDQLLKHNIRLYNCFHESTKFVTRFGVRSFTDFEVGDKTTVMTHKGNWKTAEVKSYGNQKLNKVTFNRHGSKKTFIVTPDHRWILKNGKVTTDLSVGDCLIKEPATFAEFDWDTAPQAEQLYWLYGFVYGDGTISNGYSMVRLCNSKNDFLYRFESMGFKTSSSDSLQGDNMVYVGSYQKTLPDPNQDSPEMIRAFVSGYLAADGRKNNNPYGRKYLGIQASGEESINFIKECFPIAGVHILAEGDLTGEETSYGIRGLTKGFSTSDHAGSKYNTGWKVESIEEYGEDVVWCLEVEDDESFVLDGGVVTGNCVSSYADRPNFFGELFYILLGGAGAGFSVQKHHVAKLPKIKVRKGQAKIHVVEDSIEGWGKSVDVLLSSFFEDGGKHPEFEGRRVYFDTTNIRPKGAMISGGFMAPGPEPLRKALDLIEHLLNDVLMKMNLHKLKPIHVYDICMYLADAVLAGGVRRAATICLFSADDTEMRNAKTGNWIKENPQRGRSNNSAIIIRKEIDRQTFADSMKPVKEFGEPGFIFAESTEHAFNPCVEIGMLPVLKRGKETISGWQGCNLTEGNGSKCTTIEEFERMCRCSAILGTLQAGYTDFSKFLPRETEEIFEREALIGVSITGWMNSPDILLDEQNMRHGAMIVKTTNQHVAQLIGINPAARTTTVKPSGNASVLLGTCSASSAEHSERYIRHVQMNKTQSVAKLIKELDPYMVEESVWSTSKSDYAIAFPVIAPKGSKFKKNISALDMLKIVKSIQKNWIEEGTQKEFCVDDTVRHNVSNTINVADHEWDEVEQYLFDNRDYFAGVSLLSHMGDRAFHQAPMTSVKTEKEIVNEYGEAALFASGLIVDTFLGFDNLWDATFNVRFGEQEDGERGDMQASWIRRFRNFAKNYFEGDLEKAEYCLKDVFLLHKWTKIQHNFQDIEFVGKLNNKEFTDIDTMGSAACVGGACEI